MIRLLKWWPVLAGVAGLFGAMVAGVYAFLLEFREDKAAFEQRVKRLEVEEAREEDILIDLVRDLLKKHQGHPHDGKGP